MCSDLHSLLYLLPNSDVCRTLLLFLSFSSSVILSTAIASTKAKSFNFASGLSCTIVLFGKLHLDGTINEFSLAHLVLQDDLNFERFKSSLFSLSLSRLPLKTPNYTYYFPVIYTWLFYQLKFVEQYKNTTAPPHTPHIMDATLWWYYYNAH